MSNRSSYLLNCAPRPYICSVGQLYGKLLHSGSWSSWYSERIWTLLYPLQPQRLPGWSHCSVKLFSAVRLTFIMYTKIIIQPLKQLIYLFIGWFLCLVCGLSFSFFFDSLVIRPENLLLFPNGNETNGKAPHLVPKSVFYFRNPNLPKWHIHKCIHCIRTYHHINLVPYFLISSAALYLCLREACQKLRYLLEYLVRDNTDTKTITNSVLFSLLLPCPINLENIMELNKSMQEDWRVGIPLKLQRI